MNMPSYSSSYYSLEHGNQSVTNNIIENKSVNFIYLTYIIGILSWYILPQVKYSITYVPMAIVCGLFVASQIIVQTQLKKAFYQLLPWMLMFAMMFFIVPYPLDFKKASLQFMIQFLAFMPYFMFIALAQRNRLNELKIIFIVITIMFVITEFHTINKMATVPDIARFLTHGDIDKEYTDLRMQGLAGFGFSYAMGLILSLLLALIIYVDKFKWKAFFLIYFVFTFVYVIRTQFGILVFLSIFSILYLLIRMTNKFAVKVVIYLFLGILGIFILDLSNIFDYLAMVMPGSDLSLRLRDVELLLSHGDLGGDALSGRLDVYSTGISIFLKSPIWGNVAENEPHIFEAHSVYIDFASGVGVVGLFFYIKSWFVARINVIAIIGNKAEQQFFKVPFVFLLILALLNPIQEAFEIWLALFLYVPLGILIFNCKTSENTKPMLS